jgi:hypothetical protein
VAVPAAATAVKAQVPEPSSDAAPSLAYGNADGVPGAVDCRAPDFLDFLIGQSPPPRQQIYLQGLDILNRDTRSRFGHDFAEASDPEKYGR